MKLFEIIVLFMVSAFFSAAETAFGAVSERRLQTEAENGNKAAQKALPLAQDFDSVLSTILVGNNASNVRLATISAIWANQVLGEKWSDFATLVITILVIIFGELLPKAMAKRHPEKMAKIAAPILKGLSVILRPVTYPLEKLQSLLGEAEDDKMTPEEIAAEAEDALPVFNAKIIKGSLKLNKIKAKDIFTHRKHVWAIDVSAKTMQVAKQFKKSGRSRLVVIDGDIDHVVGTIYSKAVKNDADWQKAIIQPLYVPNCMSAIDLLQRMMDKRLQMAIVVDEYGGTEGIVTLENIIEEVVGDIFDENELAEN